MGQAAVKSDDKRGLEVVERDIHIFVCRWAEDVNCDAVKHTWVAMLKVTSLITNLGNKYPGYSSLTIGVSLSKWKRFLMLTWPAGTFISHFVFSHKPSEKSQVFIFFHRLYLFFYLHFCRLFLLFYLNSPFNMKRNK